MDLKSNNTGGPLGLRESSVRVSDGKMPDYFGTEVTAQVSGPLRL